MIITVSRSHKLTASNTTNYGLCSLTGYFALTVPILNQTKCSSALIAFSIRSTQKQGSTFGTSTLSSVSLPDHQPTSIKKGENCPINFVIAMVDVQSKEKPHLRIKVTKSKSRAAKDDTKPFSRCLNFLLICHSLKAHVKHFYTWG